VGRKTSYIDLLHSGELARRVVLLDRLLESCNLCPHACEVDRRREPGRCSTSDQALVASWTPHFGEEPVISGRRGSGTVFLANCNLRCVYCQNAEISQHPASFRGRSIPVEDLADIFLELQRRGCHNVNWVSPTHQVPQLVRALARAAQDGLKIPVVYNSNGYDSVEALQLLDDVVDVYMPDLKYADAATGDELSGAPDYPQHARAAIAEMFRQVGPGRTIGADGTLERGLLIRMLVLPNQLADVEDNLHWIATELSPHVTVALMAQYYPCHKAAEPGRYPLLSRGISAGEWARAVDALERFMEGDHHFVQNRRLAPRYYRPDFSDRERPFADIEDFEAGE